MVTLNSVTHGGSLRREGTYFVGELAAFCVFAIVGALFAFALIGFFQ